MKKIFILFNIILSTSIYSCFVFELHEKYYLNKYKDWQIINIPNIGSFKVPQEWNVSYENYAYHITDIPKDEEDLNIYILGRMPSDHKNNKYLPKHELFENVEYTGNFIRGKGLSNSTFFGQEVYKINGFEEIKYFIDFNSEYILLFLIWNDSLDINIIEKIADSY